MVVDFEKACDRVPHEKILGVLQEYGVNRYQLLAVKSLYFNSEVCVRVNHNRSPWVLV